MALPKEVSALMSEGLTYKGWEEDFVGLQGSILKGCSIDKDLIKMRNKQRFFLGDRNFPEVMQLDALHEGFSYKGWKKDFEIAEICAVEDVRTFKYVFEKMKQRQGFLDGSIVPPDHALIDSLVADEGLTYEGWEEDVAEAKKRAMESRKIDGNLITMRNRQRLFLGDRDFVPELTQLETLRTCGFSYEGWKKDFEIAEMLAVEDVITFVYMFKEMKQRQGFLDGSIVPPDHALIDSLVADEGLTYDGWEEDVAEAKKRAMESRKIDGDLIMMRNRQRLFLGDRDYVPELTRLETLRACDFSYEGWKKDFKIAETFAVGDPGTFAMIFRQIQQHQAIFDVQRANGEMVVGIKLLTHSWGGGDDVYRIIRSFLVNHRSPRKPSRGAILKA